jgi:hypothetical protein
VPYTIPANNVASGHTGFYADQNNTADVLTGFGAGFSVRNTAYAGGADPTGAADSTAPFQAAITALGSNPGVITMPAGTFLISGPLVFGRNQGMTGQGRGVTKISYTGTGTCVAAFDSSFSSTLSFGGRFSGFTIDGTGAGASAVGMSWGNLGTARCSDIEIKNFTGGSAVGLKFKNGTTNVNWSEEAEWAGVLVSNNTVNVLYDTGSFDYSLYQFVIQANAGQDGIRFQNDASLEGVRFEVRGNFKTGVSSNTGAVLNFDPGNAAGTSRIDGQIFVSVECDGSSGVGHSTLVMAGSSSSKFVGTGVLEFLDETIAFQGANIVTAPGPQFGFSGRVVDHLLGKMSPGDALAVQGGSQWTEFGSLATAFPATIFLKSGDLQAFRLANGVNTVAFGSDLTRARKIDLFLAQPASGAKGTVTWPGNVVWPGGVAPVLKANNGAVDRIRLLYLPSETAWYGELIGAKAAPVAYLPANPASTISVNTPVMMGLGSTCVYTPAGTGLVQVNIAGLGATAGAAVQFNVGPRFGTGTAPVNGAADTGTRFGTTADQLIKVPSISGNTSFGFTAQVQLVTGTAYWFDLAISTNTAGDAASVSAVSMTITELA